MGSAEGARKTAAKMKAKYGLNNDTGKSNFHVKAGSKSSGNQHGYFAVLHEKDPAALSAISAKGGVIKHAKNKKRRSE